MRKKSAYRKFATGGAVLADPSAPTPEVAIAIDTDSHAAAVADDASVAFQKQIDALRKSEQLAKDRAVQATAPALNREQRVQLMRQQGHPSIM